MSRGVKMEAQEEDGRWKKGSEKRATSPTERPTDVSGVGVEEESFKSVHK